MGHGARTILTGTGVPFSTSSLRFRKSLERDSQEVFMPVLDSIHLALDDALGFGALALTISMMIALVVWFARSVAENVAKAGRRAFRPSYDSLLRENERLRDSLVDAREENHYLRSLYRDLLDRDLPARAEEERPNAA
jgi:hypothetical protein